MPDASRQEADTKSASFISSLPDTIPPIPNRIPSLSHTITPFYDAILPHSTTPFSPIPNTITSFHDIISPFSEYDNDKSRHKQPAYEHHFIVPTHNYPHSRPHSDNSAHSLPHFRTRIPRITLIFRRFQSAKSMFPVFKAAKMLYQNAETVVLFCYLET